jgi:hypothetical protein
MPNTTTIEHQITAAEERLRLAMLASDHAVLNGLISPELIFTNHLGQLLGKQDDLALHQSGILKFGKLDPSEIQMKVGTGLAIVSVRMQVVGSYDDTAFVADLRFTRVWCVTATGSWEIVAGHSSAMA